MVVGERGCQGTNRDGSPCSAAAVTGRDYCVWHDPERQQDRDSYRRRGGQNRSREARAKKLLTKGLQDLGDVRDVLLMALLKVESGDLDPKVANAMANLAGKIRDLTVGVELEEQIAEQQRRMNELSERVG